MKALWHSPLSAPLPLLRCKGLQRSSQHNPPHSQTVDMPVFFYIDSEMVTDWNCRNVNDVTLSYKFHKVRCAERGASPGSARLRAWGAAAPAAGAQQRSHSAHCEAA